MELNYIGYSKGLLSTWTAFPNMGLLLDAGEGVGTSLFKNTGSIHHLAITHEHFDHILGIPQFANIKFRSNPNQTMRVYLPGHNSRYTDIINLLGHKGSHLDIVYVKDGEKYPIGGNRFLIPFNTKHTKHSKGYIVQEQRKRLKSEFVGLSSKEIIAKKKQGVEVMEAYHFNILVYTGDTQPLDSYEHLQNAEYFFHEGTFLDKEEDVEDPYHSLFEDAVQAGVSAKAKNIVVTHISPRYKIQDVLKRIKTINLPNLSVFYGNKILTNKTTLPQYA